MNIKLTLAEMQIAAQVGIQRQIQNLKNGAVPAYGAGSKNDWQLHVEGALGEMALAKHLGVYWDGKGEMRAPDVGNIDVRTRSKHSYDLIVHDRDDDDRYIYLLTGGNGQYRFTADICTGRKARALLERSGRRQARLFRPPGPLTESINRTRQ